MLRNIEAERVRNGFSKEQISERLGISTRTYYNWINEETDIPATSLLKMGLLFGVDIGYLMEGCTGVSDMTDKFLNPRLLEEKGE